MSDLRSDNDFSRFMALVRRHLRGADDVGTLAMDADLDALGLDSQAALNLMLDLEETFGVVFPASMLNEETFANPDSLWRGLSALRGN